MMRTRRAAYGYPRPRGVQTIRARFRDRSRPVVSSGGRPAIAGLSRIEAIHPRSYNDARRIGEEFRAGVPVIMNLGDMDEMDAKRIIDFAAGLVYGLHGTIERTGKVFRFTGQRRSQGSGAGTDSRGWVLQSKLTKP